MKLQGKKAVITGGSSGIGKAMAKKFLDEGAEVAIFSRDLQKLEETKKELDNKPLIIQGDVSRLSDLDNLFQIIKETFNTLDIVVANAGVASSTKLEEVKEEEFDRIFNTNVKGTFFTLQKALPLLNEGGSMIMVSSIAATVPPRRSHKINGLYSASKAAINRFLQHFTNNFIDTKKIRINAISPGPVETPIFKVYNPDNYHEYIDKIAPRIPIGRFAQPEEMATIALFLASDDSSFIYGEEIIADGGYTKMFVDK